MAKRRYGTGTIRERNGSYSIGFRPFPGSRQIWETVGKKEDGFTRKDAEELLEKRRVEARSGRITRSRLSLREVAHDWREERAFAGLAPKTLEGENTALDVHLLPAFGDDDLDSITPDLLRRYITKKRTYPPGHRKAAPVNGSCAEAQKKPLGISAVKQQIQTLSKIFEWAIERGEAISNPCNRVKKVGLGVPSSEKEVFEIEEVKKLLGAAADEEEEAIMLLLAGCGLRIGEVFALKYEDYDPSNRALHVQRTIRRQGGKTILGDTPKTPSGDRCLILDKPIAMALNKQVQRIREQGREGNGLLFPNKVGKLRSAENFRNRAWKPALKKAGLPTTRGPHCLRHTFASELIQEGKSDSDIASKMGHKNAQITRTIYAKAFERTRATEAGIIGKYLNPNEKTNA